MIEEDYGNFGGWVVSRINKSFKMGEQYQIQQLEIDSLRAGGGV